MLVELSDQNKKLAKVDNSMYKVWPAWGAWFSFPNISHHALDTSTHSYNHMPSSFNPNAQINDNLSYSEKLLMYMRRCCLCWICDSCTGADPEEGREKDWQQKSRRCAGRDKDVHGILEPTLDAIHALTNFDACVFSFPVLRPWTRLIQYFFSKFAGGRMLEIFTSPHLNQW